MGLTKDKVCVMLESDKHAKQARELLNKYDQKEWGDKCAFKFDDKYNVLLFDVDSEDWFIGFSSHLREKTTLEKLEQILIEENKNHGK